MSDKIVINKFGGEIMGADELIKQAVNIIKHQIKNGLKPINVVSACAGVTDELELIIKEAVKGSEKYKKQVLRNFVQNIKQKHFDLIKKLSLQNNKRLVREITKTIGSLARHINTLNQFGKIQVIVGSLMSYGERLSSLIIAATFNKYKIKTKRYIPKDIGIITTEKYLDADILYRESKNRIKKRIKTNTIPIVCGFCGKTRDGNTTVLGRGGSDTTACFLGDVFKANKIYLWKTVDGVMSADPRIVKNAKTVRYLTYFEAAESGKVICNKAMQYAQSSNIPVIVANINRPQMRTVVSCRYTQKTIKMITYKKNQVFFEIRSEKMAEFGYLYKISEVFTKYKININIIRNTRDIFYIVADDHTANIKKLNDELSQLCHYLKIKPCAMVNIIGTLDWNLTNKFNILLKQTVKNPRLGAFPYKYCTRLEAIVGPKETEKMVRKLHRTFIK